AKVGMIEDGTAIGSGLATAVNRLRASTAKSKFVVLLTDGQQNAGRITPETAAEAAATLGIKVYTVGAGTRGLAPFPMQDMFGNRVYRPVQVDIDEKTLEKVALATHARYFRATDTKSLRDIYAEIDRAEKTPFEAPQDARSGRLRRDTLPRLRARGTDVGLSLGGGPPRGDRSHGCARHLAQHARDRREAEPARTREARRRGPAGAAPGRPRRPGRLRRQRLRPVPADARPGRLPREPRRDRPRHHPPLR